MTLCRRQSPQINGGLCLAGERLLDQLAHRLRSVLSIRGLEAAAAKGTSAAVPPE
jgi:hypothetical protein